MKIKFTFILLLALLFSNALFAQSAPQISQSLLKKAHETRSIAKSAAGADEKVDVLFYPEDNDSNKIDASFFSSRGIEYIKSRNYLSAKIPIGDIEKLYGIKGVKYIDFNIKARALEKVSEGRNAINASAYAYNNIGGAGVKIAVIDIGFAYYNGLKSAGELPQNLITKDFTRWGNPAININYEYQTHGSACAEIIYDIAPQAQMYLLKINDVPSIQNAFDYCKSENIRIASCSIGFSYDFWCDGTGDIAKIATDAYNNGTLPVFAAGNEADKSWFGMFNGNSEGWMIFPSGKEYLELSVNPTNFVFMMWDDFAAKNKKYTLYMYNNSETKIISSSTWAMGDRPNVFVYNKENSPRVRLKIKKENSYEDVHIRLLFDGSYINQSDKRSASSLSSPADSREALAVGAIDITNWNSGPIEKYSSWGPTRAVLTFPETRKPDITGPTGITTYTIGTRGFSGTSAAAPHIAASAALLLSLDRTMSTKQLRDKVISNYRQVASSPDNIYGIGQLFLGGYEAPGGGDDGGYGSGEDIICYPNPASISRSGHINITNLPYDKINDKIKLNVYTVAGEFVKSFNDGDLKFKNGRMTIEWNLKNENGAQVAPGVYFLTVDAPLAKKKVIKIAIQK
ncbi:MAG: S8 family serine peptidase [Endomicrobium sp.]|jgi:subtilisin family serine protease|nr:S8 family serine peptidase [Endomicrobium sp.]